VYPHPAKANDFQTWVLQFRNEAIAKGVSPAVYDTAFQSVSPIPRVIELDRKQPERTKMGFSTYLQNVMNQKRIDNGRAGLSQNRQILNTVSAAFGVPAEVIVSLWGIETSYGSNTGGYDLISALATLAWEGRRADFFKNELINALLILQGGHISRQDFKGSWAGAMGQNQFMPSSWQRYAVDFNGDTYKDIWNTKADVFASSANYLHKNGWNPTLKWGWAIEKPNSTATLKQPYLQWLKSGIHFKDRPPSIPSTTPLTLVVPDGGDGRAYLVSQNFDVIMSWNKSTYFALTVGLLSDYIAKSSPLVTQPAFNE
jgi:membrane-bound lytic murein transglycosylase B